MLPLNDPRWAELTTFFGDPEEAPKVLSEWISAIGFDQELVIYRRDLFDLFLHQVTITNAAFAIVPWLVDVCRRGVTQYKVEYLTDVALVEANRLCGGVYFNRPDTVPMSEWLMNEYHPTIQAAQNMANDILDETPDTERTESLRLIKPALFGNGTLAWKQWSGT